MNKLVLCLVLMVVSAHASPFWADLQSVEDGAAEEGLNAQLMDLGPDYEQPGVKSGISPESEVNPEELGGYSEGDMVFPDGEYGARNGLTDVSKRWPNGVVPYEISANFSENEKTMINRAIDDYHRLTCIKWVPRTGKEEDYVYFTNNKTGCYSIVGRYGGRQKVNLESPKRLKKKGTVLHEMMHSIGFLHEQNRWERDDYVTVNMKNVKKGDEKNFRRAKLNEEYGYEVPYDYRSIMHYPTNAFSRNGLPTLVPKLKGVKIGQRDKLSIKDVQKIRRMYKCE